MTSQEVLILWGLMLSVGDLLNLLQRTVRTDRCIASELCIYPQPERSCQWLSFRRCPVPVVQRCMAAVFPSLASAFDF